VSTLGYFLGLSTEELIEIILLVGLVLVAEMINTSIEFTCNAITTDIHPEIKKAKDVAAGTVLVTSILAVLIGLIIFTPKILSLL
ncbi:MAG: diacylglycerol kinase family protein, partial [Candidatus Moraniibacteriota bacterium]